VNPTLLLAATNPGEQIVFWVCATLAVLGALGMLLSKKPVHSALFVAFTMINLAILYVSLQAPFLGMIQIIVYTGAVMMLFVFVMMIVGVDASDSLVETIKGQRLAAIILVVSFAALLIGAIINGLQGAAAPSLDVANTVDGGNVQGIARLIFTDYIIAFEVVSAVLIVAAMGAMMLTHRERYRPKPTQEQMSRARFQRFAATGQLPGNLPPAGTFARHNAIDTPALLPDGSVAVESVPDPLQERGDTRAPSVEDITEVAEISEGESVVIEDGVVEDLGDEK